jgi:toxin ParE1/3/4
MKYRISREAQLDLEKMWLYTFKHWSKKQADHYINLIIDEIEYIASNPAAGDNYEHLRKGYFRSRVKSHFIFCKINSAIKKVEIIRILHQRMDLDNKLT